MSHNKNLPIRRVSRTKMLEVLNGTKGRFFTSTHIGTDKQPHVINGIRFKEQNSPMGYILVHSCSKGECRNINPQTITDLKFGGVHYKVK